jgi:hypothetical protein
MFQLSIAGFGMVLVTLPLLWMLQSTKREIE